MEFKVKKDFLLVFLVNVVLAFLVCITIPFAYNTWVFIVVFSICFAILAFYDTAVIFASCKVENDLLTFKTGVFSYKIDLKTIVKAEKSKNIYGSLALSCDRVRILTNVNGKNKVGKKYIGNIVKCVNKYVQDTLEEFNTPDTTRVMITYSTATDQMINTARSVLEQYGKFKEILVTQAGSVINSHCGQNTLGVLYLNDGDENHY